MKTVSLLTLLAILYAGCSGCGGGGGGSAGNGALSVSAGSPCFAQIGHTVIISGSAENYTELIWEQTGGTPVTNMIQNGLSLTIDISASAVNFEQLGFRLTAKNGKEEMSSDVVVTAVIYKKLYRLGTFDAEYPHRTEWKLDWSAGDASGSNTYNPGYWFSFDDSVPGGNSTVTPRPVEADTLTTDGFSGKCLKIDYTHGSNSYAYPFVGFGIKFADNADPDYKHPFDISSTTGIVFRMKGNFPRDIKISIISPLYDSWGMYSAAYTTADSWTLYQFAWSDFSFPPSSWNPGTAYPLSRIIANAAGIQFQTTSQSKGETGSISVDEVYIYEM